MPRLFASRKRSTHHHSHCRQHDSHGIWPHWVSCRAALTGTAAKGPLMWGARTSALCSSAGKSAEKAMSVPRNGATCGGTQRNTTQRAASHYRSVCVSRHVYTQVYN
ncbi:hypothetical protein TRVL_07411 [Trypanosoma vivax]|nr:hypothetical protein TRVL_07411 [Trypanosoma vivax]